MKKSSGKKDKKTDFKSLSVFVFILVAFSLLINFYSKPSFNSESPVLNFTKLYSEDLFFTYEINKYPTHVEISNVTERNISVGFSLEPSTLSFGVVPTGGNTGKRFLTLKNTQDNKAKIMFFTYGNISPMVHFSDNYFYILPETPKNVDIMLETDRDTPIGDYSGEINLVIKRPKYSFIGWVL